MTRDIEVYVDLSARLKAKEEVMNVFAAAGTEIFGF
jgi:hypothetical protein